MSVLGLNSGYTVKYNPLVSGVPSGFALGNSFRQTVILDHISLVSSLYGYSILYTEHMNIFFFSSFFSISKINIYNISSTGPVSLFRKLAHSVSQSIYFNGKYMNGTYKVNSQNLYYNLSRVDRNYSCESIV